jgi:hypothetical protein
MGGGGWMLRRQGLKQLPHQAILAPLQGLPGDL